MLNNNGFQEASTNRIEMPDMSDEGVNALLAYMYRAEIDVKMLQEEIFIELLCSAHKYNIATLEKLMLDSMLLEKPIQSFGIDSVLKLYFFAVNIEDSSFQMLVGKMLEFLKR